MYLCVNPRGPHDCDVTVLDLGRILQVAHYKRPVRTTFSANDEDSMYTLVPQTPITVTYRIQQRAGLTLTFPDSDALDTFRQFTLLRDSPLASQPCSLSYADLQELGCAPEQDITVAYQRSFLKREVVFGCDFLYRRVNDTLSPPLGSMMLPLDHSDDEWDDMKLSSSSQTSDDDHEVFYDAVESPARSWFEITV